MAIDQPESGQILPMGSPLGSSLTALLMSDSIVPGSQPSYQLCKEIFLYHPLGAKMAEGPVSLAQAQPRTITIDDAPDEVLQEFETTWDAMQADSHIANVVTMSRVYGISSLVLGCEGVATDEPLDMTKLWDLPIFINMLDPLNTAGSLVLNQIPTASSFEKPVTVTTNGQQFHSSRFQVVMNEQPVYIAYTGSAFGFVGRSVYQRALYPLKSFVRSMIADDMIATKLGLLIAKQKSKGSVVDRIKTMVAGLQRALLKQAQTNNVLGIEIDESIETLNMQNVDGAGTFSRSNIIRNIETAADMPAKMLDQETMVSGFGEGTEDSKRIAHYIERVRKRMRPQYRWFDNIVQYRAWSPPFFERIKATYPEAYGSMSYEQAFMAWRSKFKATWPSLLIEPDSEKVKQEQAKLEACIAVLQTLLPELDPTNKALLIQSALDNMATNKLMFAHEFNLDYDLLLEYLEEQKEKGDETHEAALAPPEGEATKFGKFG